MTSAVIRWLLVRRGGGLRGLLGAYLMLLAGVVLVAACGAEPVSEPSTPRPGIWPASPVPGLPEFWGTFCRHPEWPEPAIIANGILSREDSYALLDAERFEELSAEVEVLLSLVRQAVPSLASIRARPTPYEMGKILVGIDQDLRDAVGSALVEQVGRDIPVTGYAEFDALNRRLGLTGMDLLEFRYEPTSGPTFISLCFDKRLNVPAAVEAFAKLKGVRSAQPNYIYGDGSDVEALREGDAWYIVFRKAWGDCPTGCAYEELSFFEVSEDKVRTVKESQARQAPRFLELVELVRGG